MDALSCPLARASRVAVAGRDAEDAVGDVMRRGGAVLEDLRSFARRSQRSSRVRESGIARGCTAAGETRRCRTARQSTRFRLLVQVPRGDKVLREVKVWF